MTYPSVFGDWDLDRVRQLVSQAELERGRIEYKRELGNGNTTLQAIAAMANTFGGAVLVGVDETKRGADRLTGVAAVERDRLVSLCWSQLVPPFSPEIVPIKLAEEDKFVFVVVIDPDLARRPVMPTQGNKVLVRLEDKDVAPDWYRLRDLFTEQPGSGSTGGLAFRPRRPAARLGRPTRESIPRPVLRKESPTAEGVTRQPCPTGTTDASASRSRAGPGLRMGTCSPRLRARDLRARAAASARACALGSGRRVCRVTI